MRRSLAMIVMVVAAGASACAAADPVASFDRDVRSFIARHCVECHNADTQEGGLRLDDIGPIDAEGRFGNTWPEIQRRVIDGEMPPEDAPRPPEADRLRFLDWIAGEIQRARQTHGNTGGKVVLRRLNRSEYRETVRELLGLHPDIDTAAPLPDDDTFHGFDNIGSALNISPVQMRTYVENAARVLSTAFPAGEQPVTEKTRMMAADSTKHAQASDEVGVLKLKYERSGAVITKDEYNAMLAEAQAKVPKIDRTKTLWFVGGNKEYLPDGTIIDSFSEFLWGNRPAGLYRFRFHVKGVANEKGDLPMLAAVLVAPAPLANRPVVTTDLSSEFQTIEAEVFAEPHFSRLRIDVATMGNRYFNKKRGVSPPRIQIQWVELEGPINEQWPSRAWHGYFAGVPTDDAGARAILSRFAEHAFRRPPESSRIDQFFAFYQARRAAGDEFETAVKHAMQGILAAPEFVFMIESKTGSEGKRQPLDDFELASRLSYFLWSGPPDEELYALAKAGKLRQPGVVEQQARRMMQHPRAARFAENFTGQWLKLRTLGQMVPDGRKFAEWESTLQDSMRKETELFFLHILQNDLPIAQFIDSDFAMLNGRLAYFYDVPDVSGYEFRPVSIKGMPQRGGLLAQASLLTLTSDGIRTSPVKRGAFILENILGSPPPPPPNDVPPVKETKGATLRERLAAHRELPACAGCHAKIDPLGFALENFNAIGKWREQEEDTKLPVDPSGELVDGRTFASFTEFKQLLLSRRDAVARCLSEKLLLYALGRPLDFTDQPVIDEIVQKTKADGDKLSSMILAIVGSEPFLTK
jgi:cytochrome c553